MPMHHPVLLRGWSAAVLALAAGTALAQARPAVLNAAGSEIVFTTRQLGVPVEGRFSRFTASIALDPKAAGGGQVSFAIDTGSARFGSAELDTEVPKAVWLNVARFPQASFQSSTIKSTAPGRYEVAGRLTIKGQSQDVLVPVQLAANGGQGTATGSFTIRRTAFKIGEGEWTDTSMLADDVVVRFKLQLSGLPTP